MPIYAYKCASCHHADDVMQKMSDAALTVCPSCGKETYAKQLTAPGFALKGSGWYVTDFRGGNNGAAKSESETKGADQASASGTTKSDVKSDVKSDAKSDGSVKSESGKSSAAPVATPAPSAPTPAASSPSTT